MLEMSAANLTIMRNETIIHLCMERKYTVHSEKYRFSGYLNVNSSSQRDNIYNPKRLMAFQKSMLHLGISVPRCFFTL